MEKLDDATQAELTKALSKEGVFLQRYIGDLFPSSWKVIEENPFTLPPSLGSNIGKDGRIDLIAEKTFPSALGTLILECKGSEEGQKWIFVKSKETSYGSTVVAVQFISKRTAIAFNGQEGDVHVDSGINFANFPQQLLRHNMGFSLGKKGDEYSIKSNFNGVMPLEKACYQVARGTIATMLEEKRPGREQERIEGDTIDFFIPVVVTTSELYYVDFNEGEVDSNTGNIRKAEFYNKPWVLYSYPLSDYLQLFRAHPSESLKIHSMKKRMDIFVVNSKYFTDFINCIDKFFSSIVL